MVMHLDQRTSHGEKTSTAYCNQTNEDRLFLAQIQQAPCQFVDEDGMIGASVYQIADLSVGLIR